MSSAADASPWLPEVWRAREELTLEELLRRCHRDELLPLAEVLRVHPEGLGTGKLALILAGTLRRAGAHELQNLVLRGGEGPGYPRVLRELAARLDTTAQPTLERTELAILRRWVELNGARLPPEQLQALRAFLERTPEAAALVPVPPGGAPRPGFAENALEALPYLLPLLPAVNIWWLGRPKDNLLLPAVLEVARLRQLVRHRVTVGVVGSPSSGKDAAIKALFGIDTGGVHPVAGSTREVTIQRLPTASALYVVNTPGMGDVVEAVTEEARQVLHHIDVFVYVVNAQGGVQSRELADYRGCLSTGRPVLAVVNKIDTIRERDRQRYLDDARAKLGAPAEDFLAAAFDPLPQLAAAPLGVQPVQAWITHHLVELGKDPTELPWVPTELDAAVRPPGKMTHSEDGLGPE